MKNKASGEQIDLLLREAVHKNYEDELDRIPSRESLEKMYTFSEQHNERMNALFSSKGSKSVQRGDKVSMAIKWLRTAAAIFSVIMTISFCLLLTSSQVRKAVADTFSLWNNKLTSYASTVPSVSINKTVAWRPQYVPDGFVFKNASIIDSGERVFYKSGDGKELVLLYEPFGNTAQQVESEAVYSKNVIDEVEYLNLRSTDGDSNNTVVWNRNGYRFELSSELSIDELQTVALSVEK